MDFENNKQYGFFAMLDRMQYINRWSQMRNTRPENIKEHSFDVAIIAHALCILHNELNKDVPGAILPDPYKVQTLALYHDCTEIITGDLPTPIKYRNKQIKEAYKQVEEESAMQLAELLPDCMKSIYVDMLNPKYEGADGELCHKLVKAADRISAYLKCLNEELIGNREFVSAKETIRASIEKYDLPEVKIFMESFVPSYGFTLDELMGTDE